ncbi:hypothetical protein PR202_gb24215 [Eleusine coracana subsp. coracana]|uniref:Gnk2-homologous domain-containing protein n=1 Tax=Eleusine coracana subsp. coracana TaxID=191504 RepID=A0AAV5FL22_ELECO|nr:hypothetical protein PR202_gb24215 [Eleusine coracana subsp. coracana]
MRPTTRACSATPLSGVADDDVAFYVYEATGAEVDDPKSLDLARSGLMDELARAAAAEARVTNGSALCAGAAEDVYRLVQYTRDLASGKCATCLEGGIGSEPSMSPCRRLHRRRHRRCLHHRLRQHRRRLRSHHHHLRRLLRQHRRLRHHPRTTDAVISTICGNTSVGSSHTAIVYIT